MKEKMSQALGSAGFILFYIVMLLFCFAPLLILDRPLLFDIICILIILGSRYFGGIVCIGLYIWATVKVFSEPFDVFSYIFLVFAALYFLIFVIPPLKQMFTKDNSGL